MYIYYIRYALHGQKCFLPLQFYCIIIFIYAYVRAKLQSQLHLEFLRERVQFIYTKVYIFFLYFLHAPHEHTRYFGLHTMCKHDRCSNYDRYYFKVLDTISIFIEICTCMGTLFNLSSYMSWEVIDPNMNYIHTHIEVRHSASQISGHICKTIESPKKKKRKTYSLHSMFCISISVKRICVHHLYFSFAYLFSRIRLCADNTCHGLSYRLQKTGLFFRRSHSRLTRFSTYVTLFISSIVAAFTLWPDVLYFCALRSIRIKQYESQIWCIPVFLSFSLFLFLFRFCFKYLPGSVISVATVEYFYFCNIFSAILPTGFTSFRIFGLTFTAFNMLLISV